MSCRCLFQLCRDGQSVDQTNFSVVKVKCPYNAFQHSLEGTEESQNKTPGDIDLRRLMIQYADAVRKSGFFLELIDAKLYAEMFKKRLVLVDAVATADISYVDSSHILSVLAPGSVFPDHGPLFEGSMADTWGICCLSAFYELSPESARNHWIPIIFKNQVSEGFEDQVL